MRLMNQLRNFVHSFFIAFIALLLPAMGSLDEVSVVGRTDLVDLPPELLDEIQEVGGLITINSFRFLEIEYPSIVINLSNTKTRTDTLFRQLEAIDFPFSLNMQDSAYRSSDLHRFRRCLFAARRHTITKLHSSKISLTVDAFHFCESVKFLTGYDVRFVSCDIDDYRMKVDDESAWKVLRKVAADNDLDLRVTPDCLIFTDNQTKTSD